MFAAGVALRTGNVPADPAVLRELRLMFPGQLRLITGPLRWTPIPFGLLALAQAAVAIQHPRGWFIATFFAAATVFYSTWVPRQRRRLNDIGRALSS
jgi:hypothetical protein